MSKNDTDKNQSSLFSEEEMISLEPNTLFTDTYQPVTCLGREFPNDEARREFFREELRKRLPELRMIEGFPIGSDEDIIRLSDPPYYTACPNPWLNNFIAEWEKEKVQLEAEGKRNADFEVKEPYAYGISQGKNSAIYNAHSYHTKVPHEIIMRYILHYTQPGDVIHDGFMGTGMTGVASASCGHPDSETRLCIEKDFEENRLQKPLWGIRHAICGDLSPLCFHIASNYNSSPDIYGLKKAVNEIIEKLHDKFDYLYEVPTKWGEAHVNYFVWSEIMSCYACGAELNIHDLSFDYNTRTLHQELTCPVCGAKQKRSKANQIFETTYDEITGKSVSQIKYECCLMNVSTKRNGRQITREIPHPDLPKVEGFIPTNEIPTEGDEIPRLHGLGCNSIHQIYHPRTQRVLSYINNLISSSYGEYRKELMFIFTSMLPKLTRMNRYMPQHGSRALVGPMANTLYIPPQGVENNPIDQFVYQAGKVLRAFELCFGQNVIQLSSASNSSMPSDSVDYIFTDPPFGSNIMYSELNTISESWLKLFTNNKEEAISNKSQHKGLSEYQEIMKKCFCEYYRVLKPGHWMTVEFSNTSAAFWNSLQHSITSSGFIISAVTDLDKERGGLHSMIGPTAVKQDLAISCYKPTQEMTDNLRSANENSIWHVVDEHLSKVARFLQKDGKAIYISERDPRIIYDRIISYYVQNGLTIPMNSTEFQQGLEQRYIRIDGMYFSAVDASVYEEEKKNTTGLYSMGIIVDSEIDGIQWLKNQLSEEPKTYQDLQPGWMQAIGGLRKGDILPELRTLLEENFIEMEDGKWRLPNIQDDVDKNLLRTKALLREFNLYKEQAMKPKAKLKEVRVEALRAGFKQCYIDKDFQTIVTVGDKIPQNLRDEDEVLLQFYDIAMNKI